MPAPLPYSAYTDPDEAAHSEGDRHRRFGRILRNGTRFLQGRTQAGLRPFVATREAAASHSSCTAAAVLPARIRDGPSPANPAKSTTSPICRAGVECVRDLFARGEVKYFPRSPPPHRLPCRVCGSCDGDVLHAISSVSSHRASRYEDETRAEKIVHLSELRV